MDARRDPADSTSNPSHIHPAGDLKKLAAITAEAIKNHIHEQGWPAGTIVGTQAELMERYGVGRAVVVEASRQLESQGVTAMRRGVGGGLVVTGTARSSVVRTISTYLELVQVTFAEQFEAWRTIEAQSVALACRNIDEDAARSYRAQASELSSLTTSLEFGRRSMALRIAIADESGNPASALFMRVLIRLYGRSLWPESHPEFLTNRIGHLALLYREVVEAIVAKDEQLAQDLVRELIGQREEAITSSLRQFGVDDGRVRAPAPDRPQPNPTEIVRVGELTALGIRDDIARLGWPEGEKLGEEKELIERYGVGRPAVREAIRILELHAVVRPKRGRGGGLLIGRPSPDCTIANATRFLQHTSIQPTAMFEVWKGLLLGSIKLAARRADPEDLAALRSVIEMERNATTGEFRSTVNKLYGAIAQSTHNRIISIILDICTSFMMLHPRPDPSATTVARTLRSHSLIADGIASRDEALSRRRMLEFIEFIGEKYYSKAAQGNPEVG